MAKHSSAETPSEPEGDAYQIFAIARREASLEHAAEFAPIVKGPVFAALALAPLGAAAVCCVALKIAKAALDRRPGFRGSEH